MKISSNEFGLAEASMTPDANSQKKILPEDMPRKRSAEGSGATHLSPLEQGILVAEDALKSVPDVREDIIADIKRRIDCGEYKVSGEEVADMMLRRRAADRIR